MTTYSGGTPLIYHCSLDNLADYSYDHRLLFPKGTCMKVLLRRLDCDEQWRLGAAAYMCRG